MIIGDCADYNDDDLDNIDDVNNDHDCQTYYQFISTSLFVFLLTDDVQ